MSTGTEQKSYRVGNWSEYNESLVRRGDITHWFSEDVIDQWEHDNSQVRRGRPFTYSDLAIETLLTLRELFRLPYRQTEGLGRALAKLMHVDIPIPPYELGEAGQQARHLDLAHPSPWASGCGGR